MDPAELPQSLGDFTIQAVLGRGGSGIVYDATWGPRRVALKVLHRDQVGTGKERAQFLQEAQRLQQITHPSVVKVLAVGQLPDGRPYLAMERLAGDTLGTLIAKGPFSVEHALHLFGELCNAVAALHEQGLVHRDLKPENVFIVDGKHAVLLDFGIAKELDAPASTTTQEGAVRGTPAYMAPERFFGAPASIATDIYELAVIFYAMVAGRLPWDDLADPEARLTPRSLVDHANVPEALDIEVRRALSTRAQNRPASATALLGVIRAAASGVASAPEAKVTARIRPDSKAPTLVAPQLVQQPTPLAWAPTVAAPPQPVAPPRRRWLYAAAALAVAGVGSTAAVMKLRGDHDPVIKPTIITNLGSDKGSQVFSANDPWGTQAAQPEAPLPGLPLVETALTPETYRAEAAAAVQRLPTDTRFIFTVQVNELRAQQQMAHLLDKLAKHPKVQMMRGVLPPCVLSLVGDSEWIAFGAPSIATSEHATMIVRGRWKRAAVESCFGDTVAVKQLADGPKIFKLAGFGWLDFIDDHTAYLTNRSELDAEAVHALVRHGAGPQGHARDLALGLPADRSIAFVADGHANDDWDTLSLPKGSDVFGWIRVEKDGLVLDLAADPHADAPAKAAELAMRKQIDDVFSTSKPDVVGKLVVVRQRTVVHLRGTMSSVMLGFLDMAIPTL